MTSAANRDAAFENLEDLPSHLWSTLKEVFENAHDINLVVTVIAVQFAVVLLQNVPHLFFSPESLETLAETSDTVGAWGFQALAAWAGVLSAELIIAFAANVILFSLYRPIRNMHFEGPSAVANLREAFAQGSDRMLTVAAVVFIWGILSLTGLAFCIFPGLILISISWAPIYIAATTDRGAIDAIRATWEFLERQWKPIVLIAVAESLLFSFVASPGRLVPCVSVSPCMFDAVWSAILYGLFWFWGPTVMLVLEERDRAIHGSEIWPAPESGRRASGTQVQRDPGPADPEPEAAAVDDAQDDEPEDPFDSEAADVEW